MLWEVSLFLSAISGILLALPFCRGRLWIFAWFGFVPLFLALRDKSRLQSFLLSYLCGIIFWSITIYWLIHVTLLGQILLILYLSLYFGIFGLLVSKLLTIDYRLSTLLFIPSLWVLLEYLRAHLLTGFGWVLLGYSQYLNLPIIQIADIFGAYGVSFMVMMGNMAVYRLVVTRAQGHKSTRKEIKYSIAVVICIFIVLGYGYFKLYEPRLPAVEAGTTFNVSVIQGNIPQELKWTPGAEGFILDRYLGLSQEAAKDRPDLIIWPEASVPGFLGEDEWVFKAITEKTKSIGIPILTGTVVREEDKYYNSALLIDKQGNLTGRYDKLHLVPFGEYIPLKNTFKFLETIVPIGDFTPGREYVMFELPGSARAPEHQSAGSQVKFAVLICFEDTIPELSRGFVKKGADFLVNITNDGWFGRSSAPYQHLSASVFRAVENRVPVARAANTGVSCFIDSGGRIISSVSQGLREIFIPGFKSGNIAIGRGGSLYCRMGDIFVFVCLAIATFCGIIGNLKVKTE